MVTHSEERPFECDMCNKKFSTKTGLASHMLTHNGKKPYECNVCGKAFVGSSSLVERMRIHSGEKPYQCDFCDKAFSQRSTITEHKRIHTGVCNNTWKFYFPTPEARYSNNFPAHTQIIFWKCVFAQNPFRGTYTS